MRESEADAAQSTADNEQSEADTAQTSADTEQSEADAAQAYADDLPKPMLQREASDKQDVAGCCSVCR